MTFHEIRISQRGTMHAWSVQTFVGSLAEGLRLARLTWGPGLWDVAPAGQPGASTGTVVSGSAGADAQGELF